MSPPTWFALRRSTSALSIADRASTSRENPGAKRSTCASIAAVMSRVEPCGTWQYAHPVCRPAGARDGSHPVACTSSTNGRSGCSPRATAASLATISSSVPPRCTVPARATSGAAHGIGPSSAQSSLKTPGP